jgi:flagellar basal body rod protein FlgG
MGTGVYADRKYYKGEPGDLRKTETPPDVALNSEGILWSDVGRGTLYPEWPFSLGSERDAQDARRQ